MKKSVAVLMLLVVLARAGLADGDHDQAREAYEAGEIVSLGKILDAVEKSFTGDVVEVELEREDNRWIYEVELLTPEGRVIELVYDAATTELATSGPAIDAVRKKP